MILAIRTDKPESEIYLLKDDQILDQIVWHAHKELSVTILKKIDELLLNNSVKKDDLSGLIVFEGPGSYTGLRIGITVANTYAYALDIPVVGSSGENWLKEGQMLLESKNKGDFVSPNYGGEANITIPRK